MSEQKELDVPENCDILPIQSQVVVHELKQLPTEIYERDVPITIEEFATLRGYDLKATLWVSEFWNCKLNHQNRKMWIYVSNEKLSLLEYNGKKIKKQKQNFVDLLTENFKENADYFKEENNIQPGSRAKYRQKYFELKSGQEIDEKDIQPESRGKSQPCNLPLESGQILNEEDLPIKRGENFAEGGHREVHYFVSFSCFKKLCMMRSKKVREYYLMIEEIFIDFALYQMTHNALIDKRKNDQLAFTSRKYRIEYTMQRDLIFNLKKKLSQYQTMHEYHKFDKRQPVFYFVVPQRIPPEAETPKYMMDMEIGISGVSNKEGTMISSLDERLIKHRKNMNTLRIHMLIWFQDPVKVKLLEKAVKVMFVKYSNPNGAETFIKINPVVVDRYIKSFLSISTWKKDEDYFFEADDEIEKYNNLADIYDKNISLKIPENYKYSWFRKNDIALMLTNTDEQKLIGNT